MLSIGKLTPGREAYYLDAVTSHADEYYLHAGEIPGVWGGGLAGRLGLAVRVGAEEFRSVLSGLDPATGSPLVPGAGGPGRRAGFDLTFSAPKSVSLLWALTGPDTARHVTEAHDLAVADTVAFLEAEAVRARRGHAGRQVVATEGLVTASFGHRSSRAGDPHLHTHVVAANLTYGVDGKWSTPFSRQIYRWAKTAGFAYQAALRARLTDTLAVEWGPVVNGVAEIAGITPAQRRAFSARRAQIDAHLETLGATSPHAARIATLATRPAKDRSVPVAEMRTGWLATADTVGLDATSLPQHLRTVEVDPGLADRLVSPAGLTAKSTSFDRRAVLRAVAAAHPDGLDTGRLRRTAERVLDRPDVIPLTDDPADGLTRRWTTADLLAVEARLLTAARARTGEGIGVVSAASLDRVLAVRSELSDEQRQMATSLVTSGAGVEVVVGRAGTGKTFALDTARAAWGADGHPVIGTALSARAAAGLQAGAGIPSTTLDRLLADLDRPGPLPALPARAVIVVDEAGMVGTRKLDRLLTHAQRAAAKVVLVGDPRQLPEIDAGGTLAGLARVVPTSELTVNRRQSQAWERDALDQLRTGDPAVAVRAYAEQGRIVLAGTAPDARQHLVDDWWHARQAGTDRQVGMYALTRADVEDLNGRARRHLRRAGMLSGPDVTVAGRDFAVGDQILCLRNDRRLGILNGTIGTLTTISADHATLTGPDGAVHHLDADYLDARHLAHGYATTVHKAQGITVDQAFVLGTEHLYREAGYVAASRARHATTLYAVTPTGDTIPDPARPGPVDDLTAALAASRAQTLATDQLPHHDDGRKTERLAVLAADPPAWLVDTIGPPPVTDRRRMDRWADTAVRLDDYRHAHHVHDPADALGPEPDDPRAAGAWRTGTVAIRLARADGLLPDRDLDRHLDQQRGLDL